MSYTEDKLIEAERHLQGVTGALAMAITRRRCPSKGQLINYAEKLRKAAMALDDLVNNG